MRRWTKPLTYAPKIQPVLDGIIRQSIRPKHTVRVGDEILWHGWSGRPYFSPWSFRYRIVVTQVAYIYVSRWEFDWSMARELEVHPDELARLDGIVPPTGDELLRLLAKMHGLDDEKLPFQVIRW